MSLWARVQHLQGDAMRQIQSAYGVHFPIEVRHFFSQWIEEQPWHEIDDENPTHDPRAMQMLEALLKMIEEKANEITSEEMFLFKIKLTETAQQFQEIYGNNPMSLVRVVKSCLATESKLVQQAEGVNGDGYQADAHKQIIQEFDILQKCTQNTETQLRAMQQSQEAFIIQYQDSLKINAQLQHFLHQQANGQTRLESEKARLMQQKNQTDASLAQKAQELLRMRLSLADEHRATFQRLQQLQNAILDEKLISWKRQQQLAGNGAPFEASLEVLQAWCETLAELIWQNRQQIKKVELLKAQLPLNLPAGTTDLLPMLNTTITGLLSSLVTSTFIIEKQPPQVLKKDARFSASVRLLVGGKLNVHMNPPTVKGTIINEEQARSLLKNDKNVKNESCGEILNNQGTMEYSQANGQLAVNFRNMQLKKIKRAEKKGNESVCEEKFSILFQSSFTVGGGELVFQVWTLSLPVVVIVHVNQECNASGTVLWDNAFAEPGRTPFQVPDRVMWPQLADALNTKFQSITGLGLTQDNVNYLASKLFGQADDYGKQWVTWAQFNREYLPQRNFSFWDWFYAILKLTRESLTDAWKEQCIIGFVSKQLAQDWLMMKPNGTFLLRFSDSELGGITVAWVADKNGEKQVWNLAPYTSKDFAIRSLANRIMDLANLTYLFPDIPKARAFKRSPHEEQPKNTDPKDYIQHELMNVIPVGNDAMQTAAPMSYDDPATPMNPVHSPLPEQSPMAARQHMTSPGATGPMDGFGLDGQEFDGLNMPYDYPHDDFSHLNNLLSDISKQVT